MCAVRATRVGAGIDSRGRLAAYCGRSRADAARSACCHSAWRGVGDHAAATSTFAIRWLLPRLAEINNALGGTELRISTSADDMPDFTASDVDAIVVRGTGEWVGVEAVPLFAETLAPMCTPALAASLRSVDDLADATLLHPGPGYAEWRGWLDGVGATYINARHGLVFDTLELTLTAAAEGHGVAIGHPSMAQEKLDAGSLTTPFHEVVRNGASYFLLYPSQHAAQPKIRALADILVRLAQEE